MKRALSLVVAVWLAAPGLARAQERAEQEESDAPVRTGLPPHRYTYAGAGAFLVAGLGMSYWANGQMLRASLGSRADQHAEALQSARTAAATANMLYVAAGLTLAYGLALEFLPDPVADKADLTFHF